MRASERATVRKARLLVKSGDRAGALRLLDDVLQPPPPSAPQPSEQLALAVILALPFRCKRLDVEEMPVRDCLVRRSRIIPSGGGRGSPAAAATACVGCPVGFAFAVQLPGFNPPKSTIPREVLAPSQRMAHRARQLVGLDDGESVRIDPFSEINQLTPDDKIPL